MNACTYNPLILKLDDVIFKLVYNFEIILKTDEAGY